MKLAAIITCADFNKRRGLVNASMSRIEHLERCVGRSIDVYAITAERRLFSVMSLFKGNFELRKVNCCNRECTAIVKIEYYSNNRLLRKPLKLINRVLQYRNQDWGWHRRLAGHFKEYDILTAHFNDGAFVAEAAGRKYGIPYFVTWHGSDIHTIPFSDPVAKKKTISSMERASCNFFVSEPLMAISDLLTGHARKMVVYNGVGEDFVRYGDVCRVGLREKYGALHTKVVTFAGDLRPIKNAALLPDIFDTIRHEYSDDVVFWVIGDGELRRSMEKDAESRNIPCRFWGNQPHEAMPEFFNCTDVLVLPSKNEGLPLVALEAISCGANAVGSRVGGIPEAVGMPNSVELTEDFVEKFSARVVECLNSKVNQSVDSRFSWATSAALEYSEIQRVLHGMQQ